MSARVKIPEGGLLALDWGGAKVGYATSDELGMIVTPRGIFKRKARHEPWKLKPEDLVILKKLISEWQPGGIVLGLPLNADGSESEGSLGARELSKALNSALALEVILVPEILSSWAARNSGNSANEDAEAAALLIRDYLRGAS